MTATADQYIDITDKQLPADVTEIATAQTHITAIIRTEVTTHVTAATATHATVHTEDTAQMVTTIVDLESA